MKIAIFLFILCSTIFSAPTCLDEYASATAKIETHYQDAQATFIKNNPTAQYAYTFFPVSLFPFFCLARDTVKKILPADVKTIYLCEHQLTILKYVDKAKVTHIQIAALNYMQSTPKDLPAVKVYTLFFFMQNTSNQWQEERQPISITFVLADYKTATYRCR